ncbi:MAG TPA: hypothetical protein VIK52_07140, partial [Opitutaceae bacterium]
MKTRSACLIPLVMVMLFSEIPLRAETDASCCRCGSFYKLSDEGFGYLRHHIGFCPKCTAEMGGNPEEFLARLRGKHKGLSDAARLTNDQARKSDLARDEARDSIYGREGSATGFFTALIGLASEGAGGAIKKVGSGVKKGLGYYNKAADTLEGDLGWVLNEGKGWVEKNTVGAAQDKAVLKAAAAIGKNHFKQTGDARGATQKFLGAHGDIKKGVSLLESAIKFYEKTDKLANGIQDYLEHRADAERLHKEWEELTDLMELVQKEITRLEQCLELQRQQGNSTGLHRPAGLPAQRWAGMAGAKVRFASVTSLADERAELKALIYPPGEPDAMALQSALTALQRLRTELKDFIRQLEEEMVPPLLPFWHDCQAELGPDLAKALLEWADPATDKA